jgi:hypothetical protein
MALAAETTHAESPCRRRFGPLNLEVVAKSPVDRRAGHDVRRRLMLRLWHLGVNFCELRVSLTTIAVVEQDDGAAQSLRAPGAFPLTFSGLSRPSHRCLRSRSRRRGHAMAPRRCASPGMNASQAHRQPPPRPHPRQSRCRTVRIPRQWLPPSRPLAKLSRLYSSP